MGFLEKIFGDWNEKQVRRIEKIADQIEALDEQMQSLSDEELKAKTPYFKRPRRCRLQPDSFRRTGPTHV